MSSNIFEPIPVCKNNEEFFNEYITWDADMPTCNLWINKSGILRVKYFNNVLGNDYLIIYSYNYPIALRYKKTNEDVWSRNVGFIPVNYSELFNNLTIEQKNKKINVLNKHINTLKNELSTLTMITNIVDINLNNENNNTIISIIKENHI